MSNLDLTRLEKPRLRGGKLIARCPACAAEGADRDGDHLVVFDEGRGRFGCVAHAGDPDHRRRIAALAGVTDSPAIEIPRASCQHRARSLVLPPLSLPSIGELDKICLVRGFPFLAGLELAVRAGALRVSDMRDGAATVRAWVLLDSSRLNAQARRLDGEPWRSIGSKAKSLPGSQASWPIGIADAGNKPCLAFCEGGPDTLAAWSLAWWHGMHHDVTPVCMTGAGQRIHVEALGLVRGKGVFLLPHQDAAGLRAREIWTRQLQEAGARWVRPYHVKGHKDLADALRAAAVEMEDMA